mmetsp:Transcript_8453/g.28264  ORF Transcript_8453/g.28264 Transcript_8453/m.28264 type:complete len:352 (-) Transcript_8453:551-1606(-)
MVPQKSSTLIGAFVALSNVTAVSSRIAAAAVALRSATPPVIARSPSRLSKFSSLSPVPCPGVAPRLSKPTSSSNRFGRRTSQSKFTYKSGTKLGWRHKSTRHSRATLRRSECPVCDPRPAVVGVGVASSSVTGFTSAKGNKLIRKNASSCILSSKCITMYSCNTVAATAASTGARPMGATVNIARDKSFFTRLINAGCLLKSPPADSSDASTSCRPNAHTDSLCSSAPGSSATKDTENRKISSTHANPKGDGSFSLSDDTTDSARPGPGPFVGLEGGRGNAVSPFSERTLSVSARSGAATENVLSMCTSLTSLSAGKNGSRPNAACTISRSVCLLRFRKSALSLPLWWPIR